MFNAESNFSALCFHFNSNNMVLNKIIVFFCIIVLIIQWSPPKSMIQLKACCDVMIDFLLYRIMSKSKLHLPDQNYANFFPI